jgi:threonylcarbamoyladenosine tRNA methylthiotransferase MtaB
MVIVVGCYSQLKPEEVGHIEGVDHGFGYPGKISYSLLTWANSKKDNTTEIKTTRLVRHKKLPQSIFSWGDRTRSFLKIQDGCDYYCSFLHHSLCPRGKAGTTPLKIRLKRARKAVAKGYKEIVLTGVNIGDYGKSTGDNFLDLLKALEKVEGLYTVETGFH